MAEEKVLSKVEDVLAGVESFGSLMATCMALAGGNPAIAFMGAQYMHTLLSHLVKWGAITEDELAQVMAGMRRMTAERKEKMEEIASDEIWTVGI